MLSIEINYNHPTTEYALKLVDKKVVACEYEVLLAKQHIAMLKRQHRKACRWVFDESRANRFFYFFNKCVSPETGQYFKILPHQMFDFGMEYGWVDKVTGERRFSEVFNYQGRGGAKSTCAAIQATYHLRADKTYPPGKEIEDGYVIRNERVTLMAVDKTQVDEIKKPIVEIVNSTPFLKKTISAKKTKITGERYGGYIEVLSKDISNKQGGKPNVLLIDELSSFKNSRRVSHASKGLGKKEQSLKQMTTTANYYREENPALIEYNYAVNVLTKKIKNEKYLAIVREVPPSADITDVETWQMACPMFRYRKWNKYSRILFEQVEGEYKKAIDSLSSSPSEMLDFKIFRMNQWQKDAPNKYMNAKDMRKLKDLEVDELEFRKLTRGLDTILGLDFSVTKDLTAIARIYKLPDGRIAIEATGYITQQTADDRQKKENIGYWNWIQQGWVKTMDYECVNANIVCGDIYDNQMSYNNEIRKVCYDRFKAYQIATDLEEGRYGKPISTLEIRQTSTELHIPTDKLRNMIRAGEVVFLKNDCLRWCFENCYVYKSKTGGLIKVAKENKDSRKKIDLVAAVINAFARVDELNVGTLIQAISAEGYEM